MKFTIASAIVTLLGTTTLFETAIAAPVDDTSGILDDRSFLLSRDDSTDRERWCTDFKPPNYDHCEGMLNFFTTSPATIGGSMSSISQDVRWLWSTAENVQYCRGDCCVSWSDRYGEVQAISDFVESIKECTATCGKVGKSCWIRNRWTNKDGKGVEFCMSSGDYTKCRNKVPKDGFLDTTEYVPDDEEEATPAAAADDATETTPLAHPDQAA